MQGRGKRKLHKFIFRWDTQEILKTESIHSWPPSLLKFSLLHTYLKFSLLHTYLHDFSPTDPFIGATSRFLLLHYHTFLPRRRIHREGAPAIGARPRVSEFAVNVAELLVGDEIILQFVTGLEFIGHHDDSDAVESQRFVIVTGGGVVENRNEGLMEAVRENDKMQLAVVSCDKD